MCSDTTLFLYQVASVLGAVVLDKYDHLRVSHVITGVYKVLYWFEDAFVHVSVCSCGALVCVLVYDGMVVRWYGGIACVPVRSWSIPFHFVVRHCCC